VVLSIPPATVSGPDTNRAFRLVDTPPTPKGPSKNSQRFAQKRSERAGAVAGWRFRGHFERLGIDRPDFIREPIDDVNRVAIGAGFDSFRVVG
jgi:hypothetical protein